MGDGSIGVRLAMELTGRVWFYVLWVLTGLAALTAAPLFLLSLAVIPTLPALFYGG